MPPLRAILPRAILLPLLVLATMTAVAQETPPQRPLQQEMTPEEFKAAGLDKLSAAELANLNAWLDRKIDIETERAAAQAEDKVKSNARGFFNFGSSEPIVSNIAGEFRGFAKGRNYVLANGQEWEQTDTASLAGVRKTDPAVTLTPSLVGNDWYMRIDGYNTRAKVRRIK
jgi:hypothetical protein